MVVSQHDEDLENLTKYINNQNLTNLNIIVYSKDSPHTYDNEIRIRNTGLESATYLHHIYYNYDHLADYTIFLQGDSYEDKHDYLVSIFDNFTRSDFFCKSKCNTSEWDFFPEFEINEWHARSGALALVPGIN